MPYFEDNPLDRLALQPGDADTTLDLRGMAADQALLTVEQLLAAPNPGGSCLLLFDPSANDGRETLFLPLGRRLLAARRNGQLSRCLPAADGSGYFIAFT